ncbi:MAG TPA: alpha/beta hydrolase [Pyrinomonadaceae bacterium]|jgi:acetyl esterase/lipase|nr:alpha/beta hydrolase [Pyrinomonadaceae bacterium]
MTIAKLYARAVYRKEDELDSLKTQKKLSLPDPPRKLAKRCRAAGIGSVKVVWIDEANAKNGVLVYLHGGAFYFGPVKEHWDYIAAISKKTQMAALMVDYRMAPIYPHPHGLSDILEVIEKGALPQNWFFLGDSSGATMAVSAALKLKSAGGRQPKKMILMSPWMDLTMENPETRADERNDPMMTFKRLSTAAREHLGTAATADAKDPLISPIFADLSGLPPLLIQMGTADLLLSDCRKFYAKCRESGVDVVYEEYPDAFHDFMMLLFLAEAKKALNSQEEFLRMT